MLKRLPAATLAERPPRWESKLSAYNANRSAWTTQARSVCRSTTTHPPTHPTTPPNTETPKVTNSPLRGSRNPKAHNPRDDSPPQASRDASSPAAHIGASRLRCAAAGRTYSHTHMRDNKENIDTYALMTTMASNRSGARARSPLLRPPPHGDRKSPLELAPEITNSLCATCAGQRATLSHTARG